MDVDKKTGELSPTCPKCAHGGNVDLFPDKRMCMACGHVYPKQYLSDMESIKTEGILMDKQKRIEPTDAGLISQNAQDNYMKLAHAYSQLEAKLSNVQAENRKLSNIVSVLNYGMQTMVFTPSELAGHECLAKHKLLSLFDYWRKKVAPTMRALVNGNEDSQVEKLESELADKDKQLAEALAEIESLKLSVGELNGAFNARPKCEKCKCKDALIEQMREALKKCRDTFASYVLDHSGKLHITPIAPIDLCAPIREKIAKNQRMADLCAAALAAEGGDHG